MGEHFSSSVGVQKAVDFSAAADCSMLEGGMVIFVVIFACRATCESDKSEHILTFSNEV